MYRDSAIARSKWTTSVPVIARPRLRPIPKADCVPAFDRHCRHLRLHWATDLQRRRRSRRARIFGFDPGPRPADFRYSDRLTMIRREEEFYELDADLFHIATHPDRRQGVYRLLERGRHVTIEKPMAHPAHPANAGGSGRGAAQPGDGALRLCRGLQPAQFSDPRDASAPRQLSRLPDHAGPLRAVEGSGGPAQPEEPQGHGADPVPGDGALPGDVAFRHSTDPPTFAEAFPQGITVAASSAPYDPPNPEDYRYGIVDGKVTGEIRAGDMTVSICTDFKRRGGGPFKRFSIEGVADRRAFHIESVFDGTREQVLLNGKVVASGGLREPAPEHHPAGVALASPAIDGPATGRRFRLARFRAISSALGELPSGSGSAGQHRGRTARDDEIAIPRASPGGPVIRC